MYIKPLHFSIGLTDKKTNSFEESLDEMSQLSYLL